MIAGKRGLMRSAVVAFVVMAAVAGCASASRQEEADAKAQAAYANCEQLRSIGRLKNHRAAVQCAARTVLDAYDGAGYPFMDLVYVSLQARELGAERVDAGDVSDDQYRRDVTELDARIAAEDARRRKSMSFGGSANPAPQQLLVQGLPSFQAEARAAAPQPTSSGCVPLAGLRSCN